MPHAKKKKKKKGTKIKIEISPARSRGRTQETYGPHKKPLPVKRPKSGTMSGGPLAKKKKKRR